MLKRIFIVSVILIVTAFPQSIKTKLDKITSDKYFDTCLVSIQVEDLNTNKTIYKKNPKYLLRPASNMKVITSAAGLLYLTPDYEFKTDLYYDGYVSNDTLYGSVYVSGGCDPDFVTKDLYTFVDAIKSLKVSVITGNLYGDVSFKDSLYWGKGWMWDDDPSSDAPYLSSLNINDNCVEVFYDAKKNKTKIHPQTNYVEVKRIEDEIDLTIDRNWLNRKNEIIIKGKSEKKNYYSKVNVLNPAKYFLTVFSEVLDTNSIKLSGEIEIKNVPANANRLTTFSRKYVEVIDNLNKESDNLSAEMTLYAIAEKFFGKPATAKNGVSMLMKMIDKVGLDSNDYRLVDGSGVSHYNVFSAELLVTILKYFYKNEPQLFKILYESFPIAGFDGTLESRMNKTSAENNVHAKTGTLTGVSSLTGYTTAKNNHTIAFSIIMQNYIGSSAKAKEFQDEICRLLSEYK